jgi:putative inorganic carbon (HCO3(-)) transporter
MFPLFKEHTSYGAVLAMFYPAALFLAFRKSSWGINAVAILLLVILTIAIVLSYTRAAWLVSSLGFRVGLHGLRFEIIPITSLVTYLSRHF